MQRALPTPVRGRSYVAWGMIAAIDLHGCDPGRLADPDAIRAFVPSVIDAIGMRAHGPLHLERFGDGDLEGWSAMQFIETSSITVHADEVFGRCFVDVFSCRSFDPEVAAAVAVEHFGGVSTVRATRSSSSAARTSARRPTSMGWRAPLGPICWWSERGVTTRNGSGLPRRGDLGHNGRVHSVAGRSPMTDTAVQSTLTEIDEWLSSFEEALTQGDTAGAAELFAADSYWRDLVSFTWNLKTVEGQDGVKDLLDHTLETTKPRGFHTIEPPADADGVTEAWIEFETEVGRGRGHLRLKDGKAWTLLTTLNELKGHEERIGPDRPRGVEHGADPDRETWLEQRKREAEELGYETQPYVLIVGGGQGGIALGARLRHLRVPTIIVDRHPRPGDAWRARYKSLCLHDPVWYDHLPYLKFPDTWPVFSPKDKIGDWLEMYTRVMELNYWSSTAAKSARYDEEAGEWVVVVERDGEEVTLRPKQLVMATGMSGKPRMPEIPGMDVFKGDHHHSSDHPGPEGYKGKRAVVIGSNNSAHDICAALWEEGADVTMVQRSSTHIVRSDSLMEIGLGALYSHEAVTSGMTTEKADMVFASLPYRIMHEFQIPLYEQMRERDADFYRRLEAAGFDLDWGDDGSGLFMKYLRRGSGYYIDVGASELVANGDVKLQSGTVDHLTEDSVVMTDGTELPADLVVYATGYGSMNGWAVDLISQEVADKVGKVWGLGSDTTKDPGPWEGEQRNMWKPTQQEALWFHGGNLHQSRHYSLYLALQLKARAEGLDTPVYALQEVHHLS